MVKAGRRLDVNIFTLMQDSGISCENLAEKMTYRYRDMCRILEGKLMLLPVEVGKLAEVFGKTKEIAGKAWRKLEYVGSPTEEEKEDFETRIT